MNIEQKADIAVLVSGGGTNLQALIDSQNYVLKSGSIKLVVSNHSDAYALKRAEKAGIKTAVVLKNDCAGQSDFENKILKLLEENEIDLVILAGFMSILTADFTSKYPERIINVHPSLIPKFCGKGFYGLKVHQAVLDAGEKFTGATVHFVNEIPDGGQIIFQKEVAVKEGDTPEILQQRVMREAEWILLPEAAEQVSAQIVREKRKA